MAMLPFCGYNMGDYFGHWLQMGKRLKAPPQIFRVNWFRMSPDGRYLWPGFGENLRVLRWVLARVHGEVGAVETPIGYVPHRQDINAEGINVSPPAMEELLAIDRVGWLEAAAAQQKFLLGFGDRMPPEIQQGERRPHAAAQGIGKLARPPRVTSARRQPDRRRAPPHARRWWSTARRLRARAIPCGCGRWASTPRRRARACRPVASSVSAHPAAHRCGGWGCRSRSRRPPRPGRSCRPRPPPARRGRCYSPDVPPENRPSVTSAHTLPRPLRLDVRGRVQHLLHARAAPRTLVADDDDVAGLDAVGQDRRRTASSCESKTRAGPAKRQDRLVDARPSSRCSRLRRGCRTARPDRRRRCRRARRSRMQPSARVESGCREYLSCENATVVGTPPGARPAPAASPPRSPWHGGCRSASMRLAERRRVHGAHVAVDAARHGRARPGSRRCRRRGGRPPCGSADDGATLQMLGTWRDSRSMSRHGEIDAGLVRDGEQVQDGVGRTAHGDVQRHRVLERLARGDAARQHAVVAVVVVAAGQLDDRAARLLEELPARGVRGQRACRCPAAPGRAPR